MIATVEAIPRQGRLEVDIRVTADMNISAYAARQKVNNFVLREISYMMHADEPTLILGERICWHVPIILSLTSKGDVGKVGAIDIDIQTGKMNVSPQIIAKIEQYAEALATHSTL